MAFDGAFLHTALAELNIASNSHVEKIYQPSKDELLIHLRKKGFSGKLLISARSSGGRLNITDLTLQNPQTPPMFCMLARKIFSPSRFIGVRQKGLERVAELEFEAVNELGDITRPKIICEFIGGCNIILVDENYRILDALNRSDITAPRLIMSGAKYEYPDNRGKLDILRVDISEIINAVSQKNGEVSSALLDVLEGVSPLVCREICLLSFGDTNKTIEGADLSKLILPLQFIKNSIENSPRYTVLYDNEKPKDFSFIDINQYGNTYLKRHFDSAFIMLDEFYKERDFAARMKAQSASLIKTVNNLLVRANKRMNLRIKDLEATKDRETLRIYGELIKANIHKIHTGDTRAKVENYYDESLSRIIIKLDASLSPANNAAKYFKEYKKKCAASQSLVRLIDCDKEEISYLESVQDSLSRAKSTEDISEIRQELSNYGYIKLPKTANKKGVSPKIEEHLSVEGYRILVGHNNIQNDNITTRLAEKSDMWFHTKDIHGAHIVVKSGGKELSEETILFAAKLAAENSKAKNSSNVPVDYTQIKYVKKPAGAKAGMVIYTNNKTVYVTPWEK